jgi:hypothetical protein
VSIHILRTDSIARPWWRTDERASAHAGHKVLTDCCCCRMPAEETDCRIVSPWDPPHGDLGCFQEPPDLAASADVPTGAYYEPRLEIRCAAGFGCDANPKKRRGRHLREWMREC